MKKLLFIITLTLLISCEHSTPNNSDVKNTARAVIIHNLKNLNSAKFHHNEVIKKTSDNVFIYYETVNATNSFGGSIAKNAIITIKWMGNNPSNIENWTIIDAQFKDR